MFCKKLYIYIFKCSTDYSLREKSLGTFNEHSRQKKISLNPTKQPLFYFWLYNLLLQGGRKWTSTYYSQSFEHIVGSLISIREVRGCSSLTLSTTKISLIPYIDSHFNELLKKYHHFTPIWLWIERRWHFPFILYLLRIFPCHETQTTSIKWYISKNYSATKKIGATHWISWNWE